MLRMRLLNIYTHLDAKFEHDVSKLIAGYISGAVDSMSYRSSVKKKFPEMLSEELLGFKEYMDSNEYILQLWRAILLYMQGIDLRKAGSGCDPDDLRWILDQLGAEELEKVQRMAAITPVSMISEKDVVDIIQDLESYAWHLTWKHLRFIAQYDPSIEMEDLKGEIMCEIVRNIRIYQHLGDKGKVKGYAMRAAKNGMSKIIEHHTSGPRARIQSIATTLDSPLPQYQVTTLSLDYSADDSDGANLHSIVSDKQEVTEEDHLQRSFFQQLAKDITPRVRRLVQIVCGGDFDDEFEEFLRNTHGLDPDKVHQSDPQKVAKLAAEFLKLDLTEVREVIVLGINRIESIASAG